MEYAVEKCAVSSRTTNVKSTAVFDMDLGLERDVYLSKWGQKL